MGGGMGELSAGVQVPVCEARGERRERREGRREHSRACSGPFITLLSLSLPEKPPSIQTHAPLMWGCSDVVPKYTVSA